MLPKRPVVDCLPSPVPPGASRPQGGSERRRMGSDLLGLPSGCLTGFPGLPPRRIEGRQERGYDGDA